jgi:hypothetical protein
MINIAAAAVVVRDLMEAQLSPRPPRRAPVAAAPDRRPPRPRGEAGTVTARRAARPAT